MIVMKFGGTSVMDTAAIQRACGIVQERVDSRPLVVVSAMSKVTDQLLAMGRAAGSGNREPACSFRRPAGAALRHRPPVARPGQIRALPLRPGAGVRFA